MTMTRPSDARRERLTNQLNEFSVSNFFPIENYFSSAQKLFESFQKCESNLDQAYLYGKRYGKLITESLPKHNYYHSTKYKHTRLQHEKQVLIVIQKLEQIAQKMDQQEIERKQLEKVQAQKQFELLQQRAQKIQPQFQSFQGNNLEQSALDKLKLLFPKEEEKPELPRDPSGDHEEEDEPRTSTRYGLLDDDDDDDDEETLPPPMAPPSYESVSARQQFLGPTASDQEAPQLKHHHKTRGVKRKKIPMAQLKQQFRKHHAQLQHERRIQVGTIQTYQGRQSASTNGCTVISAMVAAKHLNQSSIVSDDEICSIIDRECGPILRDIRRKLGLSGAALIIPSDTHDHLVDAKILKQEFFEGAAGGNIMDPDHLGEFVKLITVGDDGKKKDSKAAATLFFREHVVSIVKVPLTNGVFVYDFVNSLPEYNQNGRMMSSRTRCFDEEALFVQLSYYAASKFNETNCTYIDKNEWDDTLADFDPRVFQGFVWHAR